MDQEANRIIEALGGATKLSVTCGLVVSAISQWRKRGIPAPWLRFLEQKYPGRVKRARRQRS